jgi:hypothetical protein
MAERSAGEGREWESGWQAHALAQRRRLATLSLMQKLDWLEDTEQLIAHMRRSRGAHPRGGRDGG